MSGPERRYASAVHAAAQTACGVKDSAAMSAQKEPIRVWHYREAPEEWQTLSENGGDEDWIAFVPDDFTYGAPVFLDEGQTFGCCTVERHPVAGGVVLIGCHA